MVERYIEVTDEYVKQLEQEIDNLKKINEKHKKLNGELREENKKQKEVIDKATNELFILKDMIYKPETREENFEIQRKISLIIKRLNGKEAQNEKN